MPRAWLHCHGVGAGSGSGDAKVAGKRLQKDVNAGKVTFVSLLGMDKAKLRAKELVEQSIEALEIYGDKANPMRQVAQFIINRNL